MYKLIHAELCQPGWLKNVRELMVPSVSKAGGMDSVGVSKRLVFQLLPVHYILWGRACDNQIRLSHGIRNVTQGIHLPGFHAWDLRQSIWTLSVWPQETKRFLDWRYVVAAKRSPARGRVDRFAVVFTVCISASWIRLSNYRVSYHYGILRITYVLYSCNHLILLPSIWLTITGLFIRWYFVYI